MTNLLFLCYNGCDLFNGHVLLSHYVPVHLGDGLPMEDSTGSQGGGGGGRGEHRATLCVTKQELHLPPLGLQLGHLLRQVVSRRLELLGYDSHVGSGRPAKCQQWMVKDLRCITDLYQICMQ